MPTARYVRIVTGMKTTEPTDIEVSGFRLLYGNNLLDISAATVRANFTPISGSLSLFTRANIVADESVIIPKAFARGSGFIYIDLGTALSFDTFQIGFGSTLDKSLLKLRIEYSTDALNYNVMDEVSQDLRLKFRAPWTFSAIPDTPTTGFPGYINRPFHHRVATDNYNILDKTARPILHNGYIMRDRRTYKTKNYNGSLFANDTLHGTKMFVPVSSYLERGKYYFEVSSESGVNGYGPLTSLFLGFYLSDDNTRQYDYYDTTVMFGVSGRYSGNRSFPAGGFTGTNTVTGGPVPPNFDNYPGAKIGFLGGFTLDTVNGIIQSVNSPFSPTFRFEGPSLTSYFTSLAARKKLMMFLMTPGNHDAINVDITFNFGDKPFVGPVPDGFVDRIGQRWEMEKDPNYKYNFTIENGDQDLRIRTLNEYIGTIEQLDPKFQRKKNVVLDRGLNYYIKGKVKDVDGKFPKRYVTLHVWPQMEEIRSTVSSTVDGTYEFLHLANKKYAVVSKDGIASGFNDEIIGPLKPALMDPNL